MHSDGDKLRKKCGHIILISKILSQMHSDGDKLSKKYGHIILSSKILSQLHSKNDQLKVWNDRSTIPAIFS